MAAALGALVDGSIRHFLPCFKMALAFVAKILVSWHTNSLQYNFSGVPGFPGPFHG